jgi:hypothetical protein
LTDGYSFIAHYLWSDIFSDSSIIFVRQRHTLSDTRSAQRHTLSSATHAQRLFFSYEIGIICFVRPLSGRRHTGRRPLTCYCIFARTVMFHSASLPPGIQCCLHRIVLHAVVLHADLHVRTPSSIFVSCYFANFPVISFLSFRKIMTKTVLSSGTRRLTLTLASYVS